MKNIFAKFQDYVKKPNRNTFDLSFYNNLTLKFGQLTPVFCKEVIPGDSFRINTAFGLQLMPMKFPVQTPMRAYIHYFYVRNRTLWKDWMDFIGGTKEGLVPPYVTPINKQEFFRVGGIADYFGVPNVMYYTETNTDILHDNFLIQNDNIGALLGGFCNNVRTSDANLYYNNVLKNSLGMPPIPKTKPLKTSFSTFIGSSFPAASALSSMIGKEFELAQFWNHVPLEGEALTTAFRGVWSQSPYSYFLSMPFSLGNVHIGNNFRECNVYLKIDRSSEVQAYANCAQTNDAAAHALCMITNPFADVPDIFNYPLYFLYKDDLNRVRYISMVSAEFEYVETDSDGLDVFKYSFVAFPDWSDNNYNDVEIVTYQCDLQNTTSTTYECLDGSLTGDAAEGTLIADSCIVSGIKKTEVYVGLQSENTDYTLVVGQDNLSDTPYDSDIHLNALPFRAYEAIYNAYYRNPQNNPFILNGTPEYNRYNTTYEGGADSTDYHLFFRNWEYDFLTSAVQSPQQGTAPLVGISVTGEATFQDEDGNTYYAQAILNDEGEITGWQSHSSNMPTGSLRLLMDMAGSGISINDLRNVNAFQRFLENNIRRGLKYREQLMSHFGVKARYDELDMPEFIGGCSTSVNVNKLSQTSESGDTPLGSFVGQASAFGQSKHSITHYCDEHGFIIGIMSVVPVPVYSQLLPKFFVKSQQLDYYFPEFGHIGYQPIQQKEVSPLQTYYNGNDLNKVFGYNRAWYDYLASTDEVHSQFRTTMRDFLMNRTFSDEPELSEEFLLVDPNQLNDVFLAGTDDDDIYAPESDKIIGSIYFDVSAKRPIPLFGIPKLTE